MPVGYFNLVYNSLLLFAGVIVELIYVVVIRTTNKIRIPHQEGKYTQIPVLKVYHTFEKNKLFYLKSVFSLPQKMLIRWKEKKLSMRMDSFETSGCYGNVQILLHDPLLSVAWKHVFKIFVKFWRACYRITGKSWSIMLQGFSKVLI